MMGRGSATRRAAPLSSIVTMVTMVMMVALVACQQPSETLGWDSVTRLIAEEFPTVPGLTTAELARALADDPSQVVLLDARAPEEFAVSHLEGARLATSVAEAEALLEQVGPDTLVVAYCSVGYRSAALVKALQARGVRNAVNLEGSIFAWANEGRPVFRDGSVVSQVHPYDDSWGVLLNRPLWP